MGEGWNSLFLQWLQELIDGNGTSSSNPSATNMKMTYKRAYKSLSESTQEYTHPGQLIKLRFIGEKICSALERKQKKYCKDNNIEMPENPNLQAVTFVSPSSAATKAKKGATSGQPKRKTAPPKPYVPRYRTGGYAVLLALRKIEIRDNSRRGATRPEIIAMGKDFCDASFEANPNMKNFYGAWNSVKTLISKNYVYQQNKMFVLTSDGRRVADKLRLVEKENETDTFKQLWSTPQNSDAFSSPNTNKTNNPFSSPSAVAQPQEEGEKVTSWEAGSYSIKIIIDTREVKGTGSSRDRSFFFDSLEELGFEVEMQALALGDAVWIAENSATGERALIDHILERKRIDDLIASIKDNRFVEQKFRLHRSGCKNVMYLIEHPPGAPVPIAFRQAYQTALSQITVIDNFFYKRTASAEETVKYLAAVTKHLKEHFERRPLTVVTPKVMNYRQSLEAAREALCNGTSNGNMFLGIDFETFSKAMNKSGMLTVRDVFIKMLMCVRGISWEKATAIQKIYKTPWHLWRAYFISENEHDRKSMLHTSLSHNISRKRISKPTSELVYQVWGSSSV